MRKMPITRTGTPQFRVRAGRLEGISEIEDTLRERFVERIRDIYVEKMSEWCRGFRNIPVKTGRLRAAFIGALQLTLVGRIQWFLPELPYSRIIEYASSLINSPPHPYKRGIEYIKKHVNEWVKEAARDVGLV